MTGNGQEEPRVVRAGGRLDRAGPARLRRLVSASLAPVIARTPSPTTRERTGDPLPLGGHEGPGPDPARIVLAVQSCPLVAGVHPGRRGAITTMTRHGRLAGVFLHRTVLVVGVIAYPEGTDAEVIAQVEAAVADHAPDMLVVVTLIARHPREPDPGSVHTSRRVTRRRVHRATARPRRNPARSAVRRFSRLLQLLALTGLGAIVLAALAGAALLSLFLFTNG